MLFTEWDLEKALAVSKEEGAQEEKECIIRALKDVLEPELIAEKLKQPVEYVLKVLNEPLYVREEETPYMAEKK